MTSTCNTKAAFEFLAKGLPLTGDFAIYHLLLFYRLSALSRTLVHPAKSLYTVIVRANLPKAATSSPVNPEIVNENITLGRSHTRSPKCRTSMVMATAISKLARQPNPSLSPLSPTAMRIYRPRRPCRLNRRKASPVVRASTRPTTLTRLPTCQM